MVLSVTSLSRVLLAGNALVVGCVLAGLLLAGCQQPETQRQTRPAPAGVIPVELRATSEGVQLYRGGHRYRIRGAGGLSHLAQVKRAGGNSIRLWSTDYADVLLDSARQHGLSVLLGIWLGREVEGFNYYDPAAVRRQRREVEAQVLRFRHHPALLMWNLGNELDLEATNPRVMEEVNELARLIHRLDPYHPVTTTLTGQLGMLRNIRAWCPELDVLSVNAYGSLATLPADLRHLGWDGPYLVTEFGGPGWWEVPRTRWMAPLEATSTAKAAFARRCYQAGVAADSAHCLGAYVFYWGHKFELTSSWHSLYVKTGEQTELVETMQRIWGGELPRNHAPRIRQLAVAGQSAESSLSLLPGHRYPVRVQATDPDGDTLYTRWELTREKPFAQENDYRQRTTPSPGISGCVPRWQKGLQVALRTPRQPGHYRLAVEVVDRKGHVATANFPFAVTAAP